MSPSAPDSHELDPGRMSLVDHLEDLRWGLLRSLLVLTVGFCGTYFYSDVFVHLLELPLLSILPPDNRSLYYTGIADKFLIHLKVSFLASVVLCSPYLLFEVWRFVAPALYRNERRRVLPFVFLGSLLFIAGNLFAYFFVIPYGYKFLLEYGTGNEKAIITLTEYFGLTLKMLLAMGLVFELPIGILLLASLGIIDASFLRRYRRHAILVIAILAAIISPTPDAFTLMVVMVPLLLLYELSIFGVGWIARSRQA